MVEAALGGLAGAFVVALVTLITTKSQVRQHKRELQQREVEFTQRQAEFERELHLKERESDERVREFEHELHQRRLEFESQTRAALRETYAGVLVAQRGSREASMRLADAGGSTENERLLEEATAAHTEFINAYHQLNLDSSRDMWFEARGLRGVLGDMLKEARNGDAQECERLAKVARDARQNLERALRLRLGYEPHQDRKNLGEYDKIEPAVI